MEGNFFYNVFNWFMCALAEKERYAAEKKNSKR